MYNKPTSIKLQIQIRYFVKAQESMSDLFKTEITLSSFQLN